MDAGDKYFDQVFPPDDHDTSLNDTVDENLQDEDDMMDHGGVDDDMGNSEDADTMISVLQTLGVNAIKAVQYVKSITRKQPTTFMEIYGRGGLSDLAEKQRRNLNLSGLAALDLRTQKPNGEPWNFNKKSDHKEALRLYEELKPDWVVGSPPCTDFSSWNIGINHKRMDPAEVERRLAEARCHLRFVVMLYKKQLARGKHFLHEHPAGARSWQEPYMVELLQHDDVKSVISHQCEYGLTSPDKSGTLQPVLKPTRWMSSSQHMINRLSRRCSRTHTHQQLVSGRAAAAAFYPMKLMLEILRGMRDEADHKLNVQALWSPLFEPVDGSSEVKVCDNVEPTQWEHVEKHERVMKSISSMKVGDYTPAWDEVLKVSAAMPITPCTFRYLNDTSSIIPLEFRDQYKDEYTSEVLPQQQIREAIRDELSYFLRQCLEGM